MGAGRLACSRFHPFHLEDRPGTRVDSLIDKTRPLPGTVQKLASVVAFSLNGGKLAIDVLGLGADVEGRPKLLDLLLAALGTEAERLAHSGDLRDSCARKELQRVVVRDCVHGLMGRLRVTVGELLARMEQTHLEKLQTCVLEVRRITAGLCCFRHKEVHSLVQVSDQGREFRAVLEREQAAGNVVLVLLAALAPAFLLQQRVAGAAASLKDALRHLIGTRAYVASAGVRSVSKARGRRDNFLSAH